jgi:hypothetical protein
MVTGTAGSRLLERERPCGGELSQSLVSAVSVTGAGALYHLSKGQLNIVSLRLAGG